jgi:very-short-patch-repair endonuclease
MTGYSAQRYLDVLLDELASAQHGVVAWWQLDAANVPRDAVDRRIARGTLHRLHRGVFAVGHRAVSLEGRRLAAVLALGPNCVLSHRTAAEHRGLLRASRSAAVHVSVLARSRRQPRRGIVVHQAPHAQWTLHDRIPTTTVAWTLLDLAATRPLRIVEQAVETAERSGVFDLAEIRPLLATGRPGVRALRTAIALYDDAPTNGELERLFLALCRDHGLPRPRVNELLEGFPVDFHWPEYRLIVECDGETHDGAMARRRDGDRDAVHALAGWRTHRISWWQVTDRPEETAQLVRRLLADQARALGREGAQSAFSGDTA